MGKRTTRLITYLNNHGLAVGAMFTAFGLSYFLWGLLGKYPYAFFVGWDEARFAIAWQKTLIGIGGSLLPLFLAFLILGVGMLYVESTRAKKS